MAFLTKHPVDVIVSVNYLFLIDQEVIDHADKLAFNLHGSLLPRYRGRTPHVWAIINNEKQVGITAHKMVLECDAGDVIEQVVVPLEHDDTGASVLAKYSQLYFPIIQRILRNIESDKLETEPQDETLATWFGKRTPDDGQIDWSWSRERIRNWIRAQSHPYPGAFCWLGERKVTVDLAVTSDLGFDSRTPNGTILQGGLKPVVKTPNGALELKTVRSAEQFQFNAGAVFG